MSQTTKVKLIVEYDVELPFTSKEASFLYPDCLWPREALALDKVSELGLVKSIEGSKGEVRDVLIYD